MNGTAANPPPRAFDTLAAQVESFITGVLTLDPEQAALRAGLTLVVVVGAALLIWGLRLIMTALSESVAAAEDVPRRARQLSVGRQTIRVARIAVVIAGLLSVLRVWGFDITDLRGSPVGAVLAVGWRLAIILVIALAVIELSQFAITQLFTRVAQRARNPRRAAQLRTLSPIFVGVVTSAMILMAAMMALSEIGVEIGPLIAGAGIVGLAVGFGAQTLVKDFLTGIFLVLEDIVSIGDVVRIGDCAGAVEEMSLRTIKLRAFDGTLHVFPYSEAQVIHNSTKNFGYAVFELQISVLSNLDHAIAVTKAAADALAKDQAFASLILSPAEIVGVVAITDNAVVLKGRIKTRPGDQWRVRREFNRRIKQAFDAEGVLFEHRHLPAPPFEDIAERLAEARNGDATRRAADR
jgi:small conductance mechanosensitive channel